MAKVIDMRQLILHCTEVNASYMRLPAGMLQEYSAVVGYTRGWPSRVISALWPGYGRSPVLSTSRRSMASGMAW